MAQRPGARTREREASGGSRSSSRPVSGSPGRKGGLPADPVPVGQIRSHRLEPITLQPRTPRDTAGGATDSSAFLGADAYRPATLPGGGKGLAGGGKGWQGRPGAVPLSHQVPSPISPYGESQQLPQSPKRRRSPSDYGRKKGPIRTNTVPPQVLLGLAHATAGVRDMNWARVFQALDVIIRYLIPCEAVSLYLVEEGGRYLRRVNTYLEAFPPTRRGETVEAVSDDTIEGAAAISGEPAFLPVKAKNTGRTQLNWASREATNLTPLASKATLKEIAAGCAALLGPPEEWAGGNETQDTIPAVGRVRSVLAFPLRFGTPGGPDPFADYASTESLQGSADETVFGVLKLTNRLSAGKKGKIPPVHLSSHSRDKAEMKYQPFTSQDHEILNSLSSFLREVYFSVDPVTFGSQIDRSLDLADNSLEPLNAPSLISGRSIAPSQSQHSGGSRMLTHVQQGHGHTSASIMAGGMFGILGNAFAKGNAYRRRAAELPDLVQRPKVQVTSDSTESMRAAPGWVHKEWTDEDLDLITAEQSAAGQRRIGGISILAVWRLREDVKIDPYCVICRFQIRVTRTSRVKEGQQAVWKEMAPFFCISTEEVNQKFCAFLTDYLAYGEEYVVSVRAGSADRWSEWSPASESVRLMAKPLEPLDVRAELQCEITPPDEPSGPLEAFRTRDHLLRFTFPAFSSFDPRTPLPVEYVIEAWQRQDAMGAASLQQLKAAARSHVSPSSSAPADKPPIPGAGPEWSKAKPMVITTTTSDVTQGKPVTCEVDIRSTALVQNSFAFFSVRARYLSLPGESTYCKQALWSHTSTYIPHMVPSLPSPLALPCGEFCVPEADTASAASALAGMGTMVLHWPFRHPANFCPIDEETGGFHKGPFIPNVPPVDFPLPFRVQCRALLAGPDVGGEEDAPPRWSEWREVEAYEFVRKQIATRHPSQRLASKWASQGNFAGEGKDAGLVLDDLDKDCLDPLEDPLNLLTSDWALLVSGLDLAEEGPLWSGLTQLRWVSCGVEGTVSAPSRTLCSRVAGLAGAPQVQHVVLNCSSGSVGGKRDKSEEEGSDVIAEGEWVVHELRHVARLTWQLSTTAPSFGFVNDFRVRYKEVPPGYSSKHCPWVELSRTSLQDARDYTVADSDVTCGTKRATFCFDVTGVPLLRYHYYVFCIQACSPEHDSDWSEPSMPLHLMLPEVVPPEIAAGEEGSTEEGSEEDAAEEEENASLKEAQSDEEERREPASPREPEQEEDPHEQAEDQEDDHQKSRQSEEVFEDDFEQEDTVGESQQDGSRQDESRQDESQQDESQGDEGQQEESQQDESRRDEPAKDQKPAETPQPAAQAKKRKRKKKGRRGKVPLKLLEAEMLCSTQDKSSAWGVELRWRPFPLAVGGAEAYPALLSLPVEFRVSYFCLSDRPCAEAKEEAVTFGPNLVKGWTFDATDKTLVAQRAEAEVCLEGSILPSEKVVVRRMARCRLPPLRCDVRLFIESRCMPVTGAQWSRLALCVDLCLPRQTPLPLPVPQQLSCADLQRRGMAMDIGMPGPNGKLPVDDLDPDGLWAVLSIPKFPAEFVEAEQGQEPLANIDLLDLDCPKKTERPADPSRHYVLQYRRHDPAAPGSSASAKPLEEERDWEEVPLVRRLDGGEDEAEVDGTERVFLASFLDSSILERPSCEAAKGHAWATFRLASRALSHFSYSSWAAPVSPLRPPERPKLAVEWVDSPSLDGIRIRVSAHCDALSQAYQLRLRLSHAKPNEVDSWVVCELSSLDLLEAGGDAGPLIRTLAPVHQMAYHSEYCFSLRSCSLTRFSPWSEDSEPFRISLEHHGMCPLEEAAGEAEGLAVQVLGLQERHSCRCPVADISWPPLTFPAGAWGPESVSPSPELTIEYRLRWRRRIDAFNDAAALFASMDELRRAHIQGDDWEGMREEGEALAISRGMPTVRLVHPDPDQDLKDIALRGYRGDSTKRTLGPPDFSPWLLGAVVPAKASGPTGVSRCFAALPFLLPGSDYEVAVDWRWRRLGDSFWMPAFASTFHVPIAPPPLPLLRPLRVLPEVWDLHAQLRELCGDVDGGTWTGRSSLRYAIFEWPFARPPASTLLPAPVGRELTQEVQFEPGKHCDFVVQCRPRPSNGPRNGWATCQSRFLVISGKPACLVEPAASASPEVPDPAHAREDPWPVTTAEADEGVLEGDEIEFRMVRSGDCEASSGIAVTVPALAPPVDVRCRLTMLGPQSMLGLAVTFHGLPATGSASAPSEYQVRVQELGTDGEVTKEQILPPQRLPLERVAEAFAGARGRLDFLGAQAAPERGELGPDFAAARGGGEMARQLEALEFEHMLSSRELCYGRRYRVAVRWLTALKVSSWSATAESLIWLPAPRCEPGSVLDVRDLQPFELPRDLSNGEQEEFFQPPVLAHRAQLAWEPFGVELWGGGRIEYRLERRSLIHDRRLHTGGNVLPSRHESEMEVTPWELVGTVLAEIKEATGQGWKQLTNLPGSIPADEYRRRIAPDSAEALRDAASQDAEVFETTSTQLVGTSRSELAASVCRTLYSRAAGVEASAPGGAEKGSESEILRFNAEELLPSVTYQFRLLARLLFHPASGFEGEWSEPLDSEWHRTDSAVHEPAAPRETVAPDPPPQELLEDGSALLLLDYLPIREAARPEDGPPPPAPYVLQFRGALAPEDADWLTLDSAPLRGDQQRILVSDPRLKQHLADGAVFRLWRCQPQSWCPSGKPHSIKDDARVRHFSSLTSVPSKPIALRCPRFARFPRTSLVFADSVDLGKASEDPPPSLILRLDWKVDALPNPALACVHVHQVRFRRVRPMPDVKGSESEQSAENGHVACHFTVDGWQELPVFERPAPAELAEIVHDMPLAAPLWHFGADYEVCVRLGTGMRWGDWSPPVPLSLALHPPEAPSSAGLLAEALPQQDGVTFFRLTWPEFYRHSLCNCIEYRVRMMRVTRYKYTERLSEEIRARSEASLAAQGQLYVIGTIRRRIPQKSGLVVPYEGIYGEQHKEEPRDTIEFVHRVPGDPECSYRFFVDAKHDHYCELDEIQDGHLKILGEQEEWSRPIESQEVLVPPLPKNYIVPEQVPIDVHSDPDKLAVPFPLSLGDTAFECNELASRDRKMLFLFAPWLTSQEPSKWPHRLEYTPYVPNTNEGRLPLPGDVDEDTVEWHIPKIEYIQETIDADASGARGERAQFAIVSEFDETLWAREMMRQGVHPEQSKALGLFARMRLVREGGPEGMSLVSPYSRPLRLSIPPVELAPRVAVWTAAGRFMALLWWPSAAAAGGELDKNLDMSRQLYQVRMRRPLYEDDAGWVESQVKKALPPVSLRRSDDSKPALHSWDVCNFLDDSIFPEELRKTDLPYQRDPLGAFPLEVLTYEFAVRVSDGYRWSDWSAASDICNFAIQPKVEKQAPVNLEELSRLLEPGEGTVCPADAVDSSIEPLTNQLTFSPDGEMEPPKWVSVAKPPRSKEVVTSTSQISQFVVSWPNMSQLAYCQPSEADLPFIEEIMETGFLPEYFPPGIVYRLNIWLLGVSPDAADAASPPTAPVEDEAAESTSTYSGEVLFQTFDVPSSSAPDMNAAEDGNPTVSELSWVLPALLPDKTFRCTIEARFQSNTAVQWWTPLFRSGEFVVERVPPPSPPEPLPICDLPTPEYNKLLARTAPGSTACVAVRWPWIANGRPLDLMRDSTYVLEYCRSTARPSLRDPTTKPLNLDGETVISGRPTGPWREAKAQTICFAHFDKGEVSYELPNECQYEANWVPVLIASGLPTPGGEDSGEELPFVHLRWRFRASSEVLSVTATPLHFSAASAPVRTKVAAAAAQPLWHMAVPDRATKLSASLQWVAWSGATKFQFSYRVLQKDKKRKKKRASLMAAAEKRRESNASDASSTEGGTDTDNEPQGLNAQDLEPVTGWLEMPPITDEISRRVGEGLEASVALSNDDLSVDGSPSQSQSKLPAEPGELGEDQLVAQYMRKIPPSEWSRLLWRHYRNQEEFYHPSQRDRADVETASAKTGSASRMSMSGLDQSMGSHPGRGRRPSADAASSAGGSSAGRRSKSGSQTGSRASVGQRKTKADMPFRLGPNSFVEWKVRVCDGFRWSDWSAASTPAGIVPPVPVLPTPVQMTFNRREPTIARLVWGKCTPAPEYEHLSGSIEYLVYLTSDEQSAKKFMQEEGHFDVRKTHRLGVQMTEGICGCLLPYKGEEGENVAECDFDALFNDDSSRRLIGKFSQKDARLVSVSEDDERPAQIEGFDLVVSGLKPQCLHRVSVCVRCATAGVDEPDWQRMKIDPTHPLRWSDPFNSPPLLTPIRPPPMLVPELIPIPDGKFGRFLHTPCILLKCAMFAKQNKDDSDKEHNVVVDVRPAGGKDEDYRVVPLENSVYCELAGHGPCRLVYNLPFLWGELRTRNVTMNDVSAASIPFFAVPPLVIEDSKGPKAELVVGQDGTLNVRLQWTSRILTTQTATAAQICVRRHAVDQPDQEHPAYSLTSEHLLEEVATSELALAGQAFADLSAEVEERHRAKGGAISADRSLFCCKHCFLPIGKKASKSLDGLGALARERLQNVAEVLEMSTVSVDNVPVFRGVDDPIRELRVPHAAEVDALRREEAEPWHEARQVKPMCSCRDVFCRKDIPVDGEVLRHGVTYTFRVRVEDGFRWSPWTEYCLPLPVVVAPPRPPLPVQEALVPAPPPMMEVFLVKDASPTVAAAASLDGSRASDLRLRLRWPRFEGRMQEVEYRVIMWLLTPEQRKRAGAGRRLNEAKGLPPLVGTQTFVTSCIVSDVVAQVDDSGAPPRIVKPGEAQENGPPAGKALPRIQKSDGTSDAPQVIGHIRPFDPPARAALKHTPKSAAAAGTGGEQSVESKVMDFEVSVVAVPKGHGYVFAVEAKHSKGALGNLGEWSAPVFSKLVEFDNQPRHLSVEVDARFGTLLFKGQAATTPKPTNEKLVLEAPAVTFLDEHRDLPKAAPLLAKPGGDSWPIGASPRKFVVRTKGRSVYADRVPDNDGDEPLHELRNEPDARPPEDDFRES